MDEVASLLFSPFLQVFFERMASGEFLDIFRGRKVNEGLLHKLKISFLSMSALCEDAEEIQLTNLAVKEWLHELKDVVYDAEDILDEIATEFLQRKFDAEFQTTASKVRNSICTSLSPFVKEVEPKIKEVLDKLEYLARQKDALGLKEGVGRESSKRLPTTSLVEESDIFGRNDDKEKIINLLLLDDACGNENLNVIPIVGMGGIGKTTLAQLVYKDKRVKERFNLQAWVCVSYEFDVLKVTKTILEEVGSSANDDSNNLNRLQLTLQEKLMGNKFLLVLDDVWNENYFDWEVLSGPFRSGAQGSTVIVTTRNDSVASVMHTVPPHDLNMLSEEDCWSLFAKHSFLEGKFDARSELEVIGRQIVKKCEGLPLAVKAIGRLLRSKLDVDEWEKILKSELWDLSIDNTNILPGLRLSYKYLPSHLKRCFAYCSILPKGYVFEKDHLVLLWMAEGLLQEPRNRTMKEVGEDYFSDLVSRSLFQQSCGNKLGFVMHDLVNDLANFVSGQFSSRQEGNKTRHLSYFRTRFDNFKKFEALYKVKRLRTFLPLEFSIRDNNLTKKVLHDLLPKQRYLRVLSLSHYKNVTNLPDSIDKIKQLRYLDLSLTAIRSLPNSLCKLINLQTLKLSCCYNLVGLPRDMRKLINLRHLDITGTEIMEMPIQLGRLKYLQTLTTFIISKTSGSYIGELGELTNLRGKLAILNLHNVVSSTDALDACLKEKKHIKDLVLEWKADTDVLESQRTILDSLQPHSNLESLTIKYYSGKSFSDWVGHHSFCNIASLYLYNCKYCCSLPPLGQLPSLEDLSFIKFVEVVKVDREFYGNGSFSIKPFGALKVLRFEKMLKWEEWLSESGAFPLLQELYICDCPKLTRELPIHLPSLIKLEIKECPLLVSSLPRAPSICQLNLTGCNKDLLKDLPTKIQILNVRGFDALDSLAMGMKESSYSLQELEISNCSSLSMGDLPSTLKSLSIKNCQRLELPMHQIFSSLKKLRLKNINDSFRSFPLDLFPNLSDIFIFGCEHLETLTISDQLGLDLMILHIRIINCPDFVSFPKGGFLASKLTLLWVWTCGRLRSLPDKMHELLPSLEELQIVNCEEVESFPDGGLPCNLKSVSITGCDNLVAGRMRWDLQKLPFLKNLSICGERGDVESFPEVGLLPTNLTALQITNFPNMKSLDKGLQQLTSLEELGIYYCPMLKYMPEKGLPASVSVLSISKCPLLRKTCQRKKGKEWRKIAHVHLIMMDNELIE